LHQIHNACNTPLKQPLYEKFDGATCLAAQNGIRSYAAAATQAKLMEIFFGDNCLPGT
jgi:hypothetical protein